MTHQSRPVVYVLHGMKRSGNHALVNWLLPQLRCVFVNNAIPLGPILRGKPFPRPLPFAAWWRKQQRGPLDAAQTLLVTLEDHALQALPFLPQGIELRRLLVVRRPEQLFSSRIRKAARVDMPAYPTGNDAVMQRAVAVWKQHARCYLGQELAHYPGRVAVSFDAWFADRAYRAAISAALGVEFDDSGFGRVGAEGGGSSFDGTAFDGRGHLMDVGNRVARLQPRERSVLDAVLADEEMQRLAGQVTSADPLALLRLAQEPRRFSQDRRSWPG